MAGRVSSLMPLTTRCRPEREEVRWTLALPTAARRHASSALPFPSPFRFTRTPGEIVCLADPIGGLTGYAVGTTLSRVTIRVGGVPGRARALKSLAVEVGRAGLEPATDGL